VTNLRKMMPEELQRRNYSEKTTRCYIRTVEDFSRRFNCFLERLGPRHIREYQAELRFRKTATTCNSAPCRGSQRRQPFVADGFGLILFLFLLGISSGTGYGFDSLGDRIPRSSPQLLP